MANRKSLLTTLNEEDQPNILFLNGTGGGEEYDGDLPIVVDNTSYRISFSESDCTGLTTLSAVTANLTNSANTISSSLTSFQDEYNTFSTVTVPTTYVSGITFTSYTANITQQLNNITDNIDILNNDVSDINDTLNSLSSIIDSKADQTDLEELSGKVETNITNISNLSASINSINDTITGLQETDQQLRRDLNDVDESVIQLVSAVDDINVELTNKVAYTDLKYEYNSEEQPVSITGIANLPIEIPGVTKNIYMHDYDNTLINLTSLEGDDYSKIIPFASADNPDLGITGTPGVISTADKYKLDNIVMFNNNSADMQLTYVGDNSGTSTFLGYSAGSLGFYDLNCPVESAMEDPNIMLDENNWSEHPFGISPELYDMLRVLSAILSESGEHPYGMIGMTESGTLGWVDLD